MSVCGFASPTVRLEDLLFLWVLPVLSPGLCCLWTCCLHVRALSSVWFEGLLPFYFYSQEKHIIFLLFFHFYLVAQQASSDQNQLSFESISWQLVALPFAYQVTISNPCPACEEDGKSLVY